MEIKKTENANQAVMLETNQALVVRERYTCANCYGHLNVYFQHSGPATVRCDVCGDGAGLVRKTTVLRRQAESRGELIEVRALLERGGYLAKPVYTVEQILAELEV